MKTVMLDIPVTADSAVIWQDERLYLLDQRQLPANEEFIELTTAEQTAQAIQAMVVRGAPAIGVTAAYGAVLAARQAYAERGSSWKKAIEPLFAILAQARPTAVNLGWAVDRMRNLVAQLDAQNPEPALLDAAIAIHQADIAANRAIGEHGARLFEGQCGVITHCNAGALATGGYGTALGVVRSAFAMGRLREVFADETRPWLQGSRLTAWELVREQIPVTLLADSAAASRMAAGGIDWVVVGADRVAANGDVANKIGTYPLALAARHHGVKVMVAAPTSTIDVSVANGNAIPIEQREPGELLSCAGQPVASAGVGAWNPVFDVTPAALVDVLVTEKGVIHEPNAEKIQNHLS